MALRSRAGDYDDEPFLVQRIYALPELPWELIAGRLEPMTISILTFDARLEAAGWQSRCDMTEAARALLLDGHLVDVGDLVLHDAGPHASVRRSAGCEGALCRLGKCRNQSN